MKRFLSMLMTILLVLSVLQVGGLMQNRVKADTTNDWEYLGYFRTIYNVAILGDPNDLNHIINLDNGKCSQSWDGGKTWKHFYIDNNQFLDLLGGGPLGINNLYFYNGYYYFDGLDHFDLIDKIYKTKDWKKIEVVAKVDVSIRSFWISPDEQIIYIGSYLNPTSNLRRFLRSLDGGKTFTDLGNKILPLLTNKHISPDRIIANSSNSKIVVVQNASDALISFDGGESFQCLSVDLIPRDSAGRLSVFWFNNKFLVIGKDKDNHIVYEESADGKNFQVITSFPDEKNDIGFWQWYNGLIIGLKGLKPYYSDDYGKTWYDLSKGLPDNLPRDYGFGFYVSGDYLYYNYEAHLYRRNLKNLRPVITSLADSGGSINPSEKVICKYKDSQTFTITPNIGYKIKDVLVDGKSVGPVSTYTFDNITQEHTIEAQFELITYTITTLAGSGGSITPSGTITVKYGESKNFTITPNPNYKIKDILVDGKSVGPVSTYTFTDITNDHTLQALFIEQKKEMIITLQIGIPYAKFVRTLDDKIIESKILILDSPPIIKNNRTLLPIRAVVEALGGTVEWDATERKVTVSLNYKIIELWIGKSVAKVNDIDTPIDLDNSKVVPEIINSRTMLPLRFVTENLGAKVDWDGSTQTITITYSNRGG